nr:hypothetical protein [Candidatus Freyarchaeota archaeon]
MPSRILRTGLRRSLSLVSTAYLEKDQLLPPNNLVINHSIKTLGGKRIYDEEEDKFTSSKKCVDKEERNNYATSRWVGETWPRHLGKI